MPLHPRRARKFRHQRNFPAFAIIFSLLVICVYPVATKISLSQFSSPQFGFSPFRKALRRSIVFCHSKDRSVHAACDQIDSKVFKSNGILSLPSQKSLTLKSDPSVKLSALLRSAPQLQNNPPTDKSFVLFRAIGNDLPPRHSQGQTYNNVKFILENEKSLLDLDVRWYINRVLDEEEQLRIVKLLIDHNQTFTIDLFNYTEYASVDFQMTKFMDYEDPLRSPLFRDFDKRHFKRQRAWDLTFEPKNHFIIHNNHARNSMLKLGIQSGAQYILPWDGNCFLNEKAWYNITTAINQISTLQSNGVSKRYFYVPMVRLTNNEPLKNPSYAPNSMMEEPQIIFHRSATARFDETKPYGYRPKVDLLWRLRIPEFQFKDDDGNIMKNVTPRKYVSDIPGYDSIRAVGWTARLYSGNKQLEEDGGALLRGLSRSDGIELIVARASFVVAQRQYNYHRLNSTLLYDRAVFAMMLDEFQRDSAPPTVRHAVVRANEVVRDAPPDSLAGESSVETLARYVMATVVAMQFQNNEQAGAKGAACVRAWFVDKTRLLPGNIYKATSLVHICVVLDAIKFLHFAGTALDDSDITAVTAWARNMSEVLETAPNWRRIYFSQSKDSVMFEVGSACVNAFAGNFHLLLRHTALARPRMHEQFAENGTFATDEGALGLVAWFLLAAIGDRIGVDVWSYSYEGSKGQSLLLEGLKQIFRKPEHDNYDISQTDSDLTVWLAAVGKRKYDASDWIPVNDIVSHFPKASKQGIMLEAPPHSIIPPFSVFG